MENMIIEEGKARFKQKTKKKWILWIEELEIDQGHGHDHHHH